MIVRIVVDDLKITVGEIESILAKVESQDEDLFYTSVRTSNKEAHAIQHSTFITARRMSGRLMGLVRIIGDSTYEYYLTEVMVLPDYQGKGIGTLLMNNALDYCKANGFMKIFLTAAPGRETYYSRFGFKATKYTVMRILPND